jgi:hypothetical protein
MCVRLKKSRSPMIGNVRYKWILPHQRHHNHHHHQISVNYQKEPVYSITQLSLKTL